MQQKQKTIQLNNSVVIHYDEGDLVSEVVLITPKIAGEWLQCNKHNRPVRRRHVAFLANEIETGAWQVNGQAIIIADDEQVLDGQHRLMAIIESGVAVKSLVIYGVKPEAFKTMDTGAVRSGGDALSLAYPDYAQHTIKAVSTAVRWCIRMEQSFYGHQDRISNTRVLEYVSKHQSMWHCAEFLGSFHKDTRPLSLGCGTALYEMFQRKNEEMAEKFMHALFTGELLEVSAPEYLLRQALAKDAQRLTRYPDELKMKMAVKAWNWRRSGRGACNRNAIAMNPRDPERLLIL